MACGDAVWDRKLSDNTKEGPYVLGEPSRKLANKVIHCPNNNDICKTSEIYYDDKKNH